MNTCAPSEANSCAVARPMPVLPPVTIATFPSSLPTCLLLFVFLSLSSYLFISYGCHGAQAEAFSLNCITSSHAAGVTNACTGFTSSALQQQPCQRLCGVSSVSNQLLWKIC